MASKPKKTGDSAPASLPASLDYTFKLFATDHRVLAQNGDGKLIDIGAIVLRGKEEFVVSLDVDELESKPEASAEKALRSIATQITFDYLDGLFTSEDVTEFHGKLADLPHIELTLDETLPRSLTDRTPPHIF
jgi:hypothetical protein